MSDDKAIEDDAEHKLVAAPAVLRATIHVTRKATGKVETYELVGEVPAQADADCRDDSVTPTTTPR